MAPATNSGGRSRAANSAFEMAALLAPSNLHQDSMAPARSQRRLRCRSNQSVSSFHALVRQSILCKNRQNSGIGNITTQLLRASD